MSGFGTGKARRWYLSPRTSRPRILLARHFVRSFRRECVVESPGIVLGKFWLSAKMYWAVTSQVDGSHLPPRGPILRRDGAAGKVVAAFVFSTSRSSENTHHTFCRQVSDLQSGDRSSPEGMMQPTLRVQSSATTRPPHQEARARGASERRSTATAARRSYSRRLVA
jgi:hypothetical protein